MPELMILEKAGPHKYISRKKVKGKWVYKYPGEKKSSGRQMELILDRPADVPDDYEGPVERGMDIDQAGEAIRYMEVEHGVFFGGAGNQLNRKAGTRDTLHYDDGFFSELRKAGDATFVHNHPGGGPLSQNDIIAALHGNLAEIRAVEPDGTIFILTRPPGGWPVEPTTHLEIRFPATVHERVVRVPDGPFSDFVDDFQGATLRAESLLREKIAEYVKTIGGYPRDPRDPFYSGEDGVTARLKRDAYHETIQNILVKWKMPAVVRIKEPEALEKAGPHKYISRRRGKGGKWVYTYPKESKSSPTREKDAPDNYRGPIRRGMDPDQAGEAIRKLKYEHGVVFGRTGNQLNRQAGTENYVVYTDDLVNKIAEDGHAVLVHNHPAGGTLSPDDLTLMIGADLAEVRAVTPYGDTYSIKRPADGWPVGTDDPKGFMTYRNDLVTAQYYAETASRVRMNKHIESHGGKAGDASHPSFSQDLWREMVLEEWNKRFDIVLGEYGLKIERSRK